jgi:hypothetical protein
VKAELDPKFQIQVRAVSGPDLGGRTYFHYKINAVLLIQTSHMLQLHCPKKKKSQKQNIVEVL